MNRALVGEPSVSAFLRSVCWNLSGNIRWMELSLVSNTSPNFYDPRKDLKNLQEKLIFFQDLLVDGEARRLGDVSVDEWMDDIKHLLYDVEDILDDIKSLNNHQVGFDDLYITSHEFKKWLEDILTRAEVLRDRSRDLDLKRGGSGYAFRVESEVTLRTPQTSSVVDLSEIHGREDDEAEIVNRLLEVDAKRRKNYDVLCIVGMGGLGKTTLAQLVFNDIKVEDHFDVQSWVCISNVFNVARATEELIENTAGCGRLGYVSLTSLQRGCGRLGHQSLASLQRLLREMVKDKRFLFVLDDVWSTSEWEIMKVPFSSCAKGSKILVTTRKITIAHALGNKEPYELQDLHHEICMKLFRDIAFGDDEDEEEEEKGDLVEKIVRACEGIPLVVKVIGSMLQGADVKKWRALSENTASWANKNDEMHSAIRFSYYNLSAKIKRCFEYLAGFPPDFIFDQDDVVRLWIAEGLVEEVEGRRLEDIAHEYYNELMARSLIQENNMMPNIVRHLAIEVSRNFCYKENSKEAPASVRHAFLVNLNAEHHKFLANAPSLRTLIAKEVEDKNVLRNTIKSCKFLRTLKIGSHDHFNQWSLGDNFMDQLIHIRYLTIIGSDIRHFPDFLGKLDKLQFLDLTGSKYLHKLPERMNDLSNLRCLILRYSSISSLPESISALNQLQVLDLTNCGSLKQLPEDIGKLRSLHTLELSGTFISSLPESICALSQLQALDLTNCGPLKQLPEDIGKLRSLRTLDLSGTFISRLPESVCALSQLQVLNLKDCRNLTQLPKDIRNLSKLQTVDLEGTKIPSRMNLLS